jgi:hypothetical protein
MSSMPREERDRRRRPERQTLALAAEELAWAPGLRSLRKPRRRRERGVAEPLELPDQLACRRGTPADIDAPASKNHMSRPQRAG